MNKLTPLMWISTIRPYPGFFTSSVALMIGGRGIDALVLIGATFALMLRGHTAHPYSIFRPLWAISLALWVYTLGLLSYANFAGQTVSIRDLFEPHRLLLMTLLLLFSFNHVPASTTGSWRRLWVGSVLIYFFIVVSQLSGFDIINALVEQIWEPSKSKYVADLNISRQTGFFINPNWAGVFLSFALAYFAIVPDMSKAWRIIMSVITLFLVVMSGSRTGLVCSLFVMGTLLFINGWFRTLTSSLIALSLLYSASQYFDLVSLFPMHHRELINVVLDQKNLKDVGTFGDRLEIWHNALTTFFLPTYGLGTGPLKLAVASVFDNQYVKWLVWYGIPGLIIHLVFFGILAINLYKIYLKKRNPFSRHALALIVMLLTFLLSSITGAFFDVTQLSFLFILLCGNVLAEADRWRWKTYSDSAQKHR